MNNIDISVKLNLIKLDRLEQERLKYYNEKIKYVKEQNYELACKMRDKEQYLIIIIDRMKKIITLNREHK